MSDPPLSHRSSLVHAQMIHTLIPDPAMTHSPLHTKHPQLVTEHLGPRIPINYNETLLKCLCGRPQIRTLNNLSIPLLDSSNEETQETDEHQ